MSDENVIFMDFFPVKIDGSDVIAGISLYENLVTDFRYDITSVNFKSEKVHEDDIFVGQDILQFFSAESKDYKSLYRRYTHRRYTHFNVAVETSPFLNLNKIFSPCMQ